MKIKAFHTAAAIADAWDEIERSVVSTGPLDYEPTCPTKKESMASPTIVRSPYLHRVELVTDIIKNHSKLGDKAANALAVQVLHALNSIPEKVR